MKHFLLRGCAAPRTPALLFEVKIDFHDVRSGVSGSDLGFFAGEWLDDVGLAWTPDMVRRLQPDDFVAIQAPAETSWPEAADELLFGYLENHYRVGIWHNATLRLYSTQHETRAEFEERCREAVSDAYGKEMRRLREVFMRRFIELENRVTEGADETPDGEVDEEIQARRLSLVQSVFSKIREDLNNLFLRERLIQISGDDLKWQLASYPETQERLEDLKLKLVNRLNQINHHYGKVTRDLEPYEVTVTRSAIEIVSRWTLWNS